MRRNTSNPAKSYPALDKVSSPGGDQERILKCEQNHFANYLDSKMNKQELIDALEYDEEVPVEESKESEETKKEDE